MNPELIKAVREYLAKQARLKAAGRLGEVTPKHTEEFFRQKTGGKFGLADAQAYLATIDPSINARNVGRSVVQGATMNFGDEMVDLGTQPGMPGFAAAMGPLAPALPGLATLGRLYRKATGETGDDMRLRESLYRGAHPVADLAGQMAGGFAAGALLPGAGAKTVLGGVARGAATGAAAGALAGAGSAEGDLRERAAAAVLPGILGGGIGAAIPALVGAYKFLRDPANRAARRVAHAAAASEGEAAATLADAKATGRSKEIMAGDLSDRLRQEADFAANGSDEALVDIAKKVQGRGREQAARMLNDVQTGLGKTPNAPDRLEQLQASRRAWAKDAFGKLRENHPTVAGAEIDFTPGGMHSAPTVAPRGESSEAMAALLKQPKVVSALAEAKQTGLIGDMPDKGALSFQMLQDIKGRLDDASTAAFRQGKENLGVRLAEASKIVRKHLADNVPGYEDAMKGYATRLRAERALVEGERWWTRDNARELARTVGRMSPRELKEFRYGMASKLVSDLENSATNRDAATKLTEASHALTGKLKIVFGDQRTFDQFMRSAGIEATMARMKNVVGGSATARRLTAQGFDPAEVGIDMATGGTASLVSAGARAAKGAVNRSTAREVGKMVGTQGADAVEKLLRQLQDRPPVAAGRGATVVAPWVLGSLFGDLLGK